MTTDDLELRRREDSRHAENRARLALAFAEFDSTGQGAVEFGEMADFGVTFLEKPSVSTGVEIDIDALAELLELDDDEDVPLPHVTSFVTDWDLDDKGFYVGAYVAAAVSFADPLISVEVPVSVVHHFTFAGVAIKDIPIDENTT